MSPKTHAYAHTYCLWAGKLAGDVECNQVLPNNDVGHAITVIGHLGAERSHRHKLLGLNSMGLWEIIKVSNKM